MYSRLARSHVKRACRANLGPTTPLRGVCHVTSNESKQNRAKLNLIDMSVNIIQFGHIRTHFKVKTAKLYILNLNSLFLNC